jgi:hypothetical protein
MSDTLRRFEAGPDPFGRTWQVEFRWLQTAISIRHSDTVDVKFIVWTDGAEAEDKQEKVVALPHEALLALSSKTGHRVTDPWCMKLAAAHLRRMIASGQDLEKTLITLAPADLEQAAGLRAAA